MIYPSVQKIYICTEKNCLGTMYVKYPDLDRLSCSVCGHVEVVKYGW